MFANSSRLLFTTKKLSGLLTRALVRISNKNLGSRVRLVFVSLFVFILVNNFFGLRPYVFTATSHLSITLTLRRILWLSLIIPAVFMNTRVFLAHLVPKGTPVMLVPFIVLIELLRRVIRPFTLGVRLAANMIAGHLLLVLTSSPIYMLNISIIGVVISGLLALTALELGVSIIQSYVFIRLGSLYVEEVSNMTLN